MKQGDIIGSQDWLTATLRDIYLNVASYIPKLLKPLKFQKLNKIVCLFVGDGTLGQGIFYETLNLIGKNKLPILIAALEPTLIVFTGLF